MAYLEFENINKYYGDNHVLKGINLSVEQGKLVTLLGPSGCGKSTLLRCLAGLEEIASGRILLAGEDITEKNPKDRNIGMVFQQYSLFPNMTVWENIAFGLKLIKMNKDKIDENVRSAVEMVELKGKEDQYPANLSGGQQQRAALARSIVVRPKVLLLDEPLSAIDARLRKSLQARIREIQQDLGLTTIFVTHDQDEAMIMSDVIHLFNSGEIEQSGSPVAMYTRPQTKFAAGFIGNYNILSSEDFKKLTGVNWSQSAYAAIRPETVELSLEYEKRDGACQFKAVVVESVPRGNVLRYTLEAGGVRLKADVLFRSFALFEPGTVLDVCVENRSCLPIDEPDESAAAGGESAGKGNSEREGTAGKSAESEACEGETACRYNESGSEKDEKNQKDKLGKEKAGLPNTAHSKKRGKTSKGKREKKEAV